MLQHSYKQLEEAYQRGVNKDHRPNLARTHPMSSQQGKGHQEMPITQTEPAQYLHDSQLDSDQDFDVTTVNPNADGQYPKLPSGRPHTAPRKAEGQQNGPACTPGSARRLTGTVHQT